MVSDVSASLRPLTKNERMSESLDFLSELLIPSLFRKKTSDSLRKPMSEFPAPERVRDSENNYTGAVTVLPFTREKERKRQ